MDTNLIKQAEKEMTKVKVRMMQKADILFFTNVFLSLKHAWIDNFATAKTDGTYVHFNPEFFLSLENNAQRLFLVLHETYHVAFQHMFRVGNRTNMKKWQHACDYAINGMLIQQGYEMPCVKGLHDTKFDNMSVYQVYDLLDDDDVENTPNPFGNDLVKPGDDENKNGEGTGDTKAHIENAKQKLDEILVRSAMQASMSGCDPGNIPSEIQIYLDKLTKPKLPWNKLLKRFYFAVAKNDYSMRRPNRRHFPQYYLPSLYSDGLGLAAVATDVSCSVSTGDFTKFINETASLFRQERPDLINFIQFNTGLVSIDKVRSAKELHKINFRGRGGTQIDPVIQWAKKHKPDVMIIFTDGYYNLTEPDPKVPILWIIYNNPKYTAPYGKVIHYEV